MATVVTDKGLRVLKCLCNQKRRLGVKLAKAREANDSETVTQIRFHLEQTRLGIQRAEERYLIAA